MSNQASDRGDRIIARIPKNQRGEEIRVACGTFNGHELVNVRVWVPKDDSTMIPTKAGVAFRAELLPDLIEALTKARDELAAEKREAAE